MTSDEHLLLISMFARHLQYQHTLVEILRSRGVLEPDDLAAFDALVRSNRQLAGILLESTRDNYLATARAHGVETRGLTEPDASE